MAQRYQLGLNIALPADWAMQVYFSHTKDKNYSTEDSSHNNVSKAAVSAALGWTIPATPAAGTAPGDRHLDQAGQRSLPQPVLRPDGHTQCNSDATLNYLNGIERDSTSTCMSGSAASKPTARCSICRAVR